MLHKSPWLLAAALLCVGLLSASCGATGEPQELEGVVAAHNNIRANVSPPAASPLPSLTWSATLAASAQAWADKCQWGHSGQAGVGENLFAGTASYTAQQVVQKWADEVADYSYQTNSCNPGKVCGHYTQVVWKGTLEVGCAKKRCPGLLSGREAEYWVCQYSPQGNFRGQKPY